MTTAIISALPEEQDGLATLLTGRAAVALEPRAVHSGLIYGKKVLLALAGVGKVSAAMTATLLIERFGVQRMVFTGVAGAVAEHVNVGDIVVGSQTMQHDMDARPLFPRYEIPYTGVTTQAADESLLTMILEALDAEYSRVTTKNPIKTHSGLIISGDRFVSSKEEVMRLRQELPHALCVEMEGAAVAQVCHAYGLPYVAVRSISDKADDNAHVDFPQFVRDVAGPIAVRLVDALMRRL